MKRLYMKTLKPCFGKKTMFFKKNIKDCKRCQFKTKCLREINGGLKQDEEEN